MKQDAVSAPKRFEFLWSFWRTIPPAGIAAGIFCEARHSFQFVSTVLGCWLCLSLTRYCLRLLNPAAADYQSAAGSIFQDAFGLVGIEPTYVRKPVPTPIQAVKPSGLLLASCRAPGRNRTFVRRLTAARSAIEPPEHTGQRGKTLLSLCEAIWRSRTPRKRKEGLLQSEESAPSSTPENLSILASLINRTADSSRASG